MTGALKITGSADTQQLIVKGNSTQTSNIQEWQNSSGAILDRVNGTGDFLINSIQIPNINTYGSANYNLTNTSGAVVNAFQLNANNDIHFFPNVNGGGNPVNHIYFFYNSGSINVDIGGHCCGGALPGTITFDAGTAYNFQINDSTYLALQTAGRIAIGGSFTSTALVHFGAGNNSTNNAPAKFTSGTLLTTPEAGAVEYNGNFYQTNAAIRFSVGGTLFDHYADGASSSTNGTFDDLYSDTLAANTFNTNGDKVRAEYGGIFVASGTATRDIKVLFGGTTILDTGALTTAVADSWYLTVTIIRESSTVVRCQATIVSSTVLGAQAFNDTTYTRITGLTLSGTNILKIQGAAAGVGAAAGDITAKLGTILFQPAI